VLAGGSIIACRLTAQCLLLLSSTTHLVEPTALSATATGVLRTDVTCAYAGFAVVGEKAEELIGRLCSHVFARLFPNGSCAETGFAGWHSLLVRPPKRSVDEISVYVSWDVGEYVWERLLHAGDDLGIVPVGLETLA